MEGFQSEEERLQEMERAVARGTYKAYSAIKARFENQADPRANLPYHNWAHTEGVIRRTQQIVEVIRRTSPQLAGSRELMVATLAAAFHDTVQDWDPVTDLATGRIKRVRKTVANESKSADEAVAFMDQENKTSGAEIFSEQDKAEVREAIMGTVPAWNGKTVIQPNISAESSIVARSVTLADLGLGGMEPEDVVDEGRRIFREENLDVLDALASGKTLTDAEKEGFRARFVESSDRQYTFIEARAVAFEQEIAGFPAETQAALKRLFGGFESALQLLAADKERVRTLTYEELRSEMGY